MFNDQIKQFEVSGMSYKHLTIKEHEMGQVQNVGVNLIPRIYHFTSLSIPASSELSSFSIPW